MRNWPLAIARRRKAAGAATHQQLKGDNYENHTHAGSRFFT